MTPTLGPSPRAAVPSPCAVADPAPPIDPAVGIPRRRARIRLADLHVERRTVRLRPQRVDRLRLRSTDVGVTLDHEGSSHSPGRGHVPKAAKEFT